MHLRRLPVLHARGFSLIELIIVMSIVVLITTIIVVRHSSFSSATLLNSAAYDVALSIRKAQTLGTSVRVDSGSFDIAYGIYVDKDAPTQVVTYLSDLGDNDAFDVDTTLETYDIGHGNKVSSFCLTQGGITTCSGSGSSDLDRLLIAFRRPKPDALILGLRNSSGPVCSGGQDCSAYIVLQGLNGRERRIDVRITGQISVQ